MIIQSLLKQQENDGDTVAMSIIRALHRLRRDAENTRTAQTNTHTHTEKDKNYEENQRERERES